MVDVALHGALFRNDLAWHLEVHGVGRNRFCQNSRRQSSHQSHSCHVAIPNTRSLFFADFKEEDGPFCLANRKKTNRTKVVVQKSLALS